MILTTPDWYAVVFYILFWLVRINGCIRRGRQPLLRGEEWFFDVHVQPGFYAGAGRRLLRQYWMRMLIPFAVDIPLAVAVLASGRLQLLLPLIVGLSLLIHVNHSFSVRLAERQARAFAIPESRQPAARVALSLTPRRLRDYTNPAFEWTLRMLIVLACAWLVRYYLTAPGHHDFRQVFGVPVTALYLQAGFLIVKRAIVEWRSGVPEEHADAHMAVSEQRRRYYLRVCDWARAANVGSLLFWPVLLSAPAANADRLVDVWLTAWLIVGAIGTVWVELERRRIVRLAMRAIPARLPDLLPESPARWPVCYEPSAPMLMLKGARGYSLNMANGVAQFSAAYLAGFAVLIFSLRMAP